MTIRQIGGVFGRHPSFQDVETDDLQVNQSVDFSPASQINLGTSTSKIAVSINSAADQFYMERPGTGETWSLQHNGGLVTHQIGTSTGIRWMKDGGEMARLRFGNLSVGTTDITNRLNIGGNIGLTGNVIVANGGGIDFSATSGTGTSELFDDYEEGTWTATVGCTGNATTTTTVTGYYTKVGRQVTVSFRDLNDIDTTGLSGFIQVSLPFTCITASVGFIGALIWDSLTYPAGYDLVFPYVANGSSNMAFAIGGSGIGDSLLGVSAITSGTTDLKYATLTYFTA